MNNTTPGKRLQILRERHGLSLSQLASRLDVSVSRQSIAKYEADKMLPRRQTLQSLCRVLNTDADYILNGHDYNLSPPKHRNPAKNPVAPEVTSELLTEVNSWLASYLYTEQQVRKPIVFKNPLDHMLIRDEHDVEQAAMHLRRAWNTGDGPIVSLCRLAERKGVIMFSTPLPNNLLGMSLWADRRYPIILLNLDNKITTTERIRFTIAHELGHLLLRFADTIDFACKNPDDDPVEKLCEIFAGNLLLPRPTLYEEIGEQRDFLTLEELTDLRRVYGVSIAAIVHQAHDLRIITDDHYNWWYDERINKNKCETGWGQYPFQDWPTKEIRMREIFSKKREGKQ